MISVAPVAPLLRSFGALGPSVAPQLVIVDHGDATGATATISGVPGETNTAIYVQSFAADLGAGQWEQMTTVFGNDSVGLDLTTGHYFAYAVTFEGASAAVSSVTYFAVTDGLESLHARCLAAVQAKIRSLVMSGLPHDNVVIQKLPVARTQAHEVDSLPAVLLTPHRTAMPAEAGTNALDDVHYDVLVSILDRDNQEPSLRSQLDRHLLWRQQIARAFRNQRLPGVPEVIDAAVEPAEGLLDEAWKRELAASALLLRFTSRETRGF